jgi:hypothetical protein
VRIAGGESRNILPYKPEARARGNVRRYPLARASGLYFPTFFQRAVCVTAKKRDTKNAD